MKNMNYKNVIVALVCAGAFLLAINQLAFAILSINQNFMYSDFIPISNNMDILPVKIGMCLIGTSALIFIIDLLVSIFYNNKKS